MDDSPRIHRIVIHGLERTDEQVIRRELLFAEPRLGNSRRSLAVQLAAGAEGHDHVLTFSRPFATLADRRAYGLALSSQKSIQRLYSEGQLKMRYQDALDSGRIWLTHSYGEQTKVRPSVQLQVSHRRFTAISSDRYAPADRTQVIPSVGLLV